MKFVLGPMVANLSRPEPGRAGRQGNRLSHAIPGSSRRSRPAEYVRDLCVGGRVVRVAMRVGRPDWPPLLLCNGIGASLEVLQPFVDALDPQRGVVRFNMPGIGGSPAPVIPYHLATLTPLLSGLLDQFGYEQADVLGVS
jgi:pimeloyl-ACP methyl ester carboxylesterase